LSENKKHITSIGGQAVIEGVMMRGPKGIGIAVRKPDGEITIENRAVSSITAKLRFLKWPVIRGVISFFESLIVGVKALMFSADFFDIEEEGEPSKFEKFLEDKFGDKLKDIIIYVSVVFSLVMGIGLFMLLPTVIVGLFKNLIAGSVWKTLIEGIVRIIIFLIYLVLVSKMKEIQRVFEYHGAEHKTIAAYENGEALTPENVKKYSRLHPRCGTSFLLIVMVISIIVFSFLKWDNVWVRMGLRLALLPLVAGISYEIIKWAGRSRNICVNIVSKPGLWLQNLTTREPDLSQIEVAIAALESVKTNNTEDDTW
jgi:uncharacterized protein YqhQ